MVRLKIDRESFILKATGFPVQCESGIGEGRSREDGLNVTIYCTS